MLITFELTYRHWIFESALNFTQIGINRPVRFSDLLDFSSISDALFSEIIVPLFSISALTNAPTAMAFLGFLCAGEAQVIVIEQVTFDIIKALLS